MRARIVGTSQSLIFEQGEDGQVYWVWFGPKDDTMPDPATFQRLPASPDSPVGPVVMPDHGRGFQGISQLEAHGVESSRRFGLGPQELVQGKNSLKVIARDAALGLEVISGFFFRGDVLVMRSHVINSGAESLDISRIASALIPAPDWADRVITHAGAWGREGHAVARDWTTGRVEQVGRGGRPGFDGGPTLSVVEAGAGAQSGRWLTAHLAWSGPFRLAAERSNDGSGQILAEQLFAPGEMRLQAGWAITLPDAWLAVSHQGSNAISTAFHSAIRQVGRRLPRPVHFNTWEARYFDVNEAGCIALVKEAAELGAERFILDDGWFKGRRDDTTSLGDWTVDEDQFPNGLGPVIEAVHDAGMEFGLWLEPEMVSPDSDLYRAHPDWVLGWPDSDLATGRNQLVLDLALPQVCEHLYDAIAALLDAYPITYLKWDCNRDLYPTTREGVVRSGDQTLALYALLDRIRSNYPVEIESCASGGGRIDAGIAAKTDRFWTSDATDAIDRMRIQRAASLIMPPERLGCHVGPSPNPMTGRQIPMAFRVLTALFGHFGIEADPSHFTETERAILKRGIALYKAHRDWMQSATQIMGSEPGADLDVQIMVAEDGGQALLRILRVDTPVRPLQPRVRLAGLDPKARYRLVELALEGEPIRWTLGDYPGSGLMSDGLALDPGRAQTGRLVHLERTG